MVAPCYGSCFCSSSVTLWTISTYLHTLSAGAVPLEASFPEQGSVIPLGIQTPGKLPILAGQQAPPSLSISAMPKEQGLERGQRRRHGPGSSHLDESNRQVLKGGSG